MMRLRGSLGAAVGRLLLRASLVGRHIPKPEQANSLALFELNPRHRTVLVTHVAATRESIAALIEDTKLLRSAVHRVVYLTDYADFSALREAGCIFEYLPCREQQLKYAPDAPWSSYLADRYALIVAKWTPAATVAFGVSLEVLIDEIRAEERKYTATGSIEPEAAPTVATHVH
jgi:hypothetical protein